MKQIYTNTTEKVYLKVYRDGTPVDAITDPTFSISIVGSSVAARTGTALKESTGVYYFLTDLSETLTQGVLKVDWTYNIDGDLGSRTDYISVVTPYASFMEIKELAPSGTSDLEIELAEQFSRFMINAYTGTEFCLIQRSIHMEGNNRSVLVLPYRIETLNSVAVDGEVLWTANPAYNGLGRDLSISDTSYAIVSVKSDDVPAYYEFAEWPAWKKYHTYTIDGLFGWSNVPDEVEWAAKLLADDYFCKETAWKKRFVEQINASDWRVVFNQKQFQGTGNYFADQALSRFRSIGMVLI